MTSSGLKQRKKNKQNVWNYKAHHEKWREKPWKKNQKKNIPKKWIKYRKAKKKIKPKTWWRNEIESNRKSKQSHNIISHLKNTQPCIFRHI